jgi:nucleotide-binding universal stress UspA family protein
MFRTILLPTDFSDHSDYALKLACALARDYRASLVLLHVGPPATALAHAALLPVLATRHEELRQQLRQLVPADAKLHVEPRVEQGDPAAEILRVAQETHADLIVMGTHGRTGIGRLLMGSVAELVLRQAVCPVVMVKTPHTETDLPSKTGAV